MVTLLNCIQRIPTLIDEMVNGFPEIYKQLDSIQCKIKKIIFVASGSSYNAAFVSQSFLERECNLDVQLIYPNVFNKLEKLDNDENILYVFVSQTGTTKLVYENLKRANVSGCNTLAITSNYDTPISKEAKYSIVMGCKDEEYRYRTIGFSTTLVTCWLLGCYISNNLLYKELFDVIKDLQFVEKNALKWYAIHKFDLMKRSTVLFTGADSLWPVGIEADIKFMEMIPYMTKTYELEEFMHGPQNAFNATQIFFVLAKKGYDEEKAIAMAKFLKNEIGICYMVSDIILDGDDFVIEINESNFYELKYICFFQVIAYMLATDHGRDLHKGINTSILNYLQKSLY